jgi:hypothetical protein
MTCASRAPAWANSTEMLGVKKAFDKPKKIRKMFLVGAPGFEPGASCAQGRRATENKRPVFNVPAETKQLNCDRSMWLAVRKCAHLSVAWAQKLAQSRVLTTVRTYRIVQGKAAGSPGNILRQGEMRTPDPLLRRTYALPAGRCILSNCFMASLNCCRISGSRSSKVLARSG